MDSEKQNSKEILEEKSKSIEKLKEVINDIESTEPEKTEIIGEDGKKVLVFKDPLYSREKRSVINYTIFRGKWEFEDLDEIDEEDGEKCAVKFTPIRDASSISVVFKSLRDRLEFMDSIYSDNEMKQLGTGMSLEKFANSKVFKTTSGLVGLSVAAYSLYKLFGKDKE